jgi:hypothetical protein
MRHGLGIIVPTSICVIANQRQFWRSITVSKRFLNSEINQTIVAPVIDLRDVNEIVSDANPSQLILGSVAHFATRLTEDCCSHIINPFARL